MSKVTCIDSGDLYNLSCGHIISDFDVEGPPTLGDEVACPICADTEKRVKAARVEALEKVKNKVYVAFCANSDNLHGWKAIERAIDKQIAVDKDKTDADITKGPK